ncbi:hypothetical protein [Chitinimonas taiwanensis]|uniref:Uncharacterized protein n=1 Tax=Chitinimonas taiwanensis DSM 18899 TaxID=1121279 RepID=A0A1K2HRA4_9NEIS|nr:hypothetical protein [Chitinimonas taiwanensis]SFZ79303.1 hypothetical protein SAMN02745887_03490 [Chitinimonas taiwanensis DSM 18899]
MARLDREIAAFKRGDKTFLNRGGVNQEMYAMWGYLRWRRCKAMNCRHWTSSGLMIESISGDTRMQYAFQAPRLNTNPLEVTDVA